MTQHTPGPWRFSFESVDPEWAIVTTSGGSIVANVNADHRQDANARLIAAAPDMKAALLLVRDSGMRNAAWDAVCAALAKEEGRS